MWSRVRGWGGGAAGGFCRLAVRLVAGPASGWEAAGVARLEGRTRSKIRKLFSTSSMLSTENDKSTASKDSTTEVASKSQKGTAEAPKQKLLDIIGSMTVEVSYREKLKQLKTREIKKEATNTLEGLDSEHTMLQRTTEDVQGGKPLNPELVEAVSAVASSLPLNKKQTESELLAQLRRHEETTDKQKKGGIINIRNVISEMAVKRQSPAQRGVRISSRISLKLDEDDQRIKPERLSSQSFDSRRSLKVGRRLNIFTKASKETENALKTGMEDDAEFHEHIFLEKHLKDFPKQGPIRHFMELVICGLSKNPYLSVKQKIEHIEWFQNYFEEKKELLQEI
ncbi:small ribosomal subunit protein mS31 isoform X2 [Strix uralensis]|uniref:small ribosomal subunit protein mS31 isoform X2 n=1 Tax=Strix uralensis TaxID=36305 RepID=UPI003DA78401